MTRMSWSKVFLFLALFAVCAGSPAASAQDNWEEDWKLYDLRDLIGLKPSSVAAVAPTPLGQALFNPLAQPVASKRTPVDELMDRLCGELGINHVALLPGVYGIQTEEEYHAALLGMLEQVRKLYAERYVVEILWYVVSPDDIPSIGQPFNPPPSVSHRHRQVIARREPTELVLVSGYTYISGLQPVVGTGAIGYHPETRREESGLRLTVLVGAARETDSWTSIQVTGELRQVVPGKMSGPLAMNEARTMEIELPEVKVRSIHSSIQIELHNDLYALAVMDGFNEGECIVLAASVEKLEQ